MTELLKLKHCKILIFQEDVRCLSVHAEKTTRVATKKGKRGWGERKKLGGRQGSE